jgi:PPK2 family polyphosphate:nucleotide phosphotransferase
VNDCPAAKGDKMGSSLIKTYQVPFDGSFKQSASPTAPPPDAPSDKQSKKLLKPLVEELREQQRVLYADDRYSVLLVFQAMDAAGKDGTIRAVLTGVNPAGFQVFSFKQPSPEELDHDFLWRTARRLPERGRIGIFNRSYYEEVLVVRVHPEYLGPQRLPMAGDLDELWKQRFHSINEHEKHLAENGTIVIKFWLNVSPDEQKKRFLARLDDPEKHWKFSAGDVKERSFWNEYMHAYEETLQATSKPWAPWYAIPADSKPYMRYNVARIVVETLKSLELSYPVVEKKKTDTFGEMRSILTNE